jgi:hypothetical protein
MAARGLDIHLWWSSLIFDWRPTSLANGECTSMNMTRQAEVAPRWMFVTLWLAGIYNLVWGAFAILLPLTIFEWAGMEPPRYPELWQCIGMIVGVYGIGYIVAAYDPARHWPITLVGLLGKVFGPIGFASALWQGNFPARFGATIITNDLVWWVPFALILLYAYREHKAVRQRSARPAA